MADHVQSHDPERAAAVLRLLVSERDRIALELQGKVVNRLFRAGLALQAVMEGIDPELRGRLGLVVDELDEAIREIRSTVFDRPGRPCPGLPPPPGES